MFMVTFAEETHEEWENKSREFKTEDAAKIYIDNNIVRSDFKHLRLWSPVDEVSIDYKEKFEELYDYVLKQSGIRTPEKQEKTSKSATVKD